MSSILKALEKVEESRTARREGNLVGMSRERQRRSPWVIPACVLTGAAAAALATYAAMGGFARHPAVASHPAPSVSASSEPAVSAPVPAPPAAPAAVAPPAVPQAAPRTDAPVIAKAAAPSAPATPAPRAGAAKAAKPTAQAVKGPEDIGARPMTKKEVAASLEVALRRPVARAGTSEQPHPAAAVKPQAQKALRPAAAQASSSAAPPAFKVTGIAWQKDASSSIAMINGHPVGEGATVEGAKVLEIQPEKVKLSGSSGIFEVPLGAGQ